MQSPISVSSLFHGNLVEKVNVNVTTLLHPLMYCSMYHVARPTKPSLGFSYCKHKSWEWGQVGPTYALKGLVPQGQWLLWSIASIVRMRMKQGLQLLRTAFSSMSRKLLAPHLGLGDILVIPSTDATQLKGCHTCLHETGLSHVSCKLCWTSPFVVTSLTTLHCKPFSLLV